MSQRKHLSLAGKLTRIMKAADSIPMLGHNDLDDYDFVRENDLLKLLRGLFAKHHILPMPEVLETRRYPVARVVKGGTIDSFVTEQRVRWTFHDGDSPDTITAVIEGAGEDPMDKGVYKALTGSLKYLLLKSFLLPSGDDAEKDSKSSAKALREQKTEAAQEVGRAKVNGTHKEKPTFPLYCIFYSDESDAFVGGSDEALAANRETLMYYSGSRFDTKRKAYIVPFGRLDDFRAALAQQKVNLVESGTCPT